VHSGRRGRGLWPGRCPVDYPQQSENAGDRGHPAVVEPDHVRHAGCFNRLGHFLGLGDVHRQRLFADDHLACLGGGERDLVVHVVRRADVDQVDVDRSSRRRREDLVEGLRGEDQAQLISATRRPSAGSRRS